MGTEEDCWEDEVLLFCYVVAADCEMMEVFCCAVEVFYGLGFARDLYHHLLRLRFRFFNFSLFHIFLQLRHQPLNHLILLLKFLTKLPNLILSPINFLTDKVLKPFPFLLDLRKVGLMDIIAFLQFLS